MFTLFVSVNGAAWIVERTFDSYFAACVYAEQMETKTRAVRCFVRRSAA